jgi:signal transduction histidine kinase
METAGATETADPTARVRDRQTVLLLRWVLIIATAYLMLFHRPLSETPPIVALFVAAYLGSNVIAGRLLARSRNPRTLEPAIVLFDAIAVSLALLLTQEATSDFFLLYFVVMFIGSLSERLELVLATAFLIAVLHIYTSALVGGRELLESAYLLRIPFLFVVALFFGYFVQRSRCAERAAREARERERLRTEFLHGVIHDLKNPLGILLGLAEILLEGPDAERFTPSQADIVRRIHAHTNRLVRLALNLLDASAIEAGRLRLQLRRASLPEVAAGTVTVARSAAELKGIEIRFSAPPGLPELDIDPIQMERAIWNLLDNAIRHTPTGGRITVSLACLGSEVLLEVVDSGAGIPSAELPHLFERQQRARSGHVFSSGLGLFIVRAIVEAHGGRVQAANAPAAGACFRIALPAPRPSEVPHELPAPALAAQRPA